VEFERMGSGNFVNVPSKLAPASRAWRVSELAGGVGGMGFMAPFVAVAGGRLTQSYENIAALGARPELTR
jgi:hypothetical protein